jgi:hypothetical protein
VSIFRGIYEALAAIPDRSTNNNDPIPSILIITRPQIDIDYPLWEQARQVWRESQSSIEEYAHEVREAGFVRV